MKEENVFVINNTRTCVCVCMCMDVLANDEHNFWGKAFSSTFHLLSSMVCVYRDEDGTD